MKKFLHWDLDKSAPNPPVALDQRILAAAAMRANGVKRRKLILRISLPVVSTIAAAASALIISGVTIHQTQPATIKKIEKTEIVQQPAATVKHNMLALADMTDLEQVNYTIALTSEAMVDDEIPSF